MKQFDISLHTFQDVHDFVEIATVQPFRVLIGNDRTRVNAKSFMGLFSLDLNAPVQVRADCNDEQYARFQLAADRFLVK